MRFGILGTGVVGKTIAARLTSLGHEVMVGTRDPEETMSRTEPDTYGNPPFSAWQQDHPEVELGTFGEAAAQQKGILSAAPKEEVAAERIGDTCRRKLLSTLLD